MSSDRTPLDSFVDQLADAVRDHEASRTAAIMARYRPDLEAEFGAEVTARVVDDRGFLPWALAEMERRNLDEPCEPAWDAVAYLQQHPAAAPADAFTAIADGARREREQ